ncbi:hypothetical protein D3C72_1202090 [compost metagenome]
MNEVEVINTPSGLYLVFSIQFMIFKNDLVQAFSGRPLYITIFLFDVNHLAENAFQRIDLIKVFKYVPLLCGNVQFVPGRRI